MKIDDKDIEDGVRPLPVRRGCGAWGPCACTGKCKQIIGYIDYDLYTYFLSNYVSQEEFVDMHMKAVEKTEPQEVEPISFEMHLPPGEMVIRLSEIKRHFVDSDRPFVLTAFGKRITKENQREFQFIKENRKELEELLKKHNGHFFANNFE